jgi:Putative adhesin
MTYKELNVGGLERQRKKKRSAASQLAGCALLAGAFLVAAVPCFGQNVDIRPEEKTTIKKITTPRTVRRVDTADRNLRHVNNESSVAAEKAIATEARVNVSLCVSEGTVRINGWERNEVRAYVASGTKVGFKVLQKGKQNSPVWVVIMGFDPLVDKEVGIDECISGDQIEIDVPKRATVNLKGQSADVDVESVNKVKIENIGGDILLSDISGGIEAKTYEGDVTVERSGGSITLLSTTGNIAAFGVGPSEIGDGFTAKTSSGIITLQEISHRQVEVGSNSGSIRYTGSLTSGGQYNLGTTNGSIVIDIPPNSSCKIGASYGGAFQSDFVLSGIVKAPGPPVEKLTGRIGTGDCSLTLTTYSGAVRIKKKT